MDAMTERESTLSGSERRPRFRELIAEAIKYWEPRRIAYNVVLAAVVIFYFTLGWPASKAFLSINAILILFILAVVANVCYCGAYTSFCNFPVFAPCDCANGGCCFFWERCSPR